MIVGGRYRLDEIFFEVQDIRDSDGQITFTLLADHPRSGEISGSTIKGHALPEELEAIRLLTRADEVLYL